MFASLEFSCRESPVFGRPSGLWKKNRPTPPPTLDSSSLFILLLPKSFFCLSFFPFPFPPFLLFFPSFLSSCPPFFLFLFGIIAIIQLHHNRKKAVLGSCFIVVEFLSPPKRYKKGGFKSFLSPFFSTPWLFFVPNKDIHEGGAEVRGSTWETRDVTTYFIRGIHRASIQSETCTNSVVFGARSGPLSS